jgi:hypothetical protein
MCDMFHLHSSEHSRDSRSTGETGRQVSLVQHIVRWKISRYLKLRLRLSYDNERKRLRKTANKISELFLLCDERSNKLQNKIKIQKPKKINKKNIFILL